MTVIEASVWVTKKRFFESKKGVIKGLERGGGVREGGGDTMKETQVDLFLCFLTSLSKNWKRVFNITIRIEKSARSALPFFCPSRSCRPRFFAAPQQSCNEEKDCSQQLEKYRRRSFCVWISVPQIFFFYKNWFNFFFFNKFFKNIFLLHFQKLKFSNQLCVLAKFI